MKISRNAHVEATDGSLGRVTHVIVDPETREVTHLVTANDIREWVIPVSAVHSIDGEYVSLRGPVSEYLNSAERFDRDQYSGVDDEHAREESRQQALHGGAPLLDATDSSVVVGSTGRTASPTSQPPPPTPARAAAPPAAATTAVTPEEPYRLQLRSEQLQVGKQEEQAGLVRLRREITEHMETVQVPLREERLIIECLPGVGRVLVGDRELHAGETMEVTLMQERAAVTKQTVVNQDVLVRKEIVQHTEQVTETLREEQLAVDDPNALIVGGTGSPSAGPSLQAARPAAGQRSVTPGTGAQFIPRPDVSAAARPENRRPGALTGDASETVENISVRPAERMERAASSGYDMYDPTPRPTNEFARDLTGSAGGIANNPERRPLASGDQYAPSIGEVRMQDQETGTGIPAPVDAPTMRDVAANRDRALDEAADRNAQARPAGSGQFNPGAEEYHQTQRGGVAGTGGTLNPGVPPHEPKTGI